MIYLFSANFIFAIKYRVARKGSAVFITGTSTGIGKAAALHFATMGYVVFGTVRHEAHATELQETLGKAFISVVCDVAKPDMIKAAAAEVKKKLEKRSIQLAAVINNAGVS